MTIDEYGALVINRVSRILIVLHYDTYSECCERCPFFSRPGILIRKYYSCFCVFYLCIIYDWITIM